MLELLLQPLPLDLMLEHELEIEYGLYCAPSLAGAELEFEYELYSFLP